jgi:hypothetical protein
MRAMSVACVLAACNHGAAPGTTLALRAACESGTYWTGSACAPRGTGAQKIAAGKDALAKQDVDAARAALDDAEHSGGPLDHDANVTLWEQRGIASAYLDDDTSAAAAFDMLLALDPSHVLSYRLAPKATFVFERVRDQLKLSGAPALDVRWQHGQKVGDAVPLDVEVVADPKQFLKRATLFVRTRGDASWRAADLALDKTGSERHLVLPPVEATKSVSLEVYLRAYDDRGNEVLTWANPTRPREIPLRYDPPQAWWKKWWVLTIAGGVLAVGTGITVYQLTLAPPDKIGGGISVAH